jgi:hypothetical protein
MTVNRRNSDPEMTRRGVLTLAGGAIVILSGLGAYACDAEDVELTTAQAYPEFDWKPTARRDIQRIYRLNEDVKSGRNSEGAQEELNGMKLDPVLQEYRTLVEEGLIQGNRISMGRYEIGVVDHKLPVLFSGGYIDERTGEAIGEKSDMRVTVNVYDRGPELDENELLDLAYMPFRTKKRLDLKGVNWDLAGEKDWEEDDVTRRKHILTRSLV